MLQIDDVGDFLVSVHLLLLSPSDGVICLESSISILADSHILLMAPLSGIFNSYGKIPVYV